MRNHIVLVSSLLLLGACTGTSKQPSAEVPSPGPTNSGGAPDLDKTNSSPPATGGPVNTGGTPDKGSANSGGAPDMSKTQTSPGPSPTNSGGKPDVSKSIPKNK